MHAQSHAVLHSTAPQEAGLLLADFKQPLPFVVPASQNVGLHAPTRGYIMTQLQQWFKHARHVTGHGKPDMGKSSNDFNLLAAIAQVLHVK